MKACERGSASAAKASLGRGRREPFEFRLTAGACRVAVLFFGRESPLKGVRTALGGMGVVEPRGWKGVGRGLEATLEGVGSGGWKGVGRQIIDAPPPEKSAVSRLALPCQ